MSRYYEDVDPHTVDLGVYSRPEEPSDVSDEDGPVSLHARRAGTSSTSSPQPHNHISTGDDISSITLAPKTISHRYESVSTIADGAQDENPPKKRRNSAQSPGESFDSVTTNEFERSSVTVAKTTDCNDTPEHRSPSLLKSIAEYFRAFNAKESPKQVCGDQRSSALWYLALFHLPSITITLLLLVLYLIHFRWVFPHPTPDELSALQFAAKAHETLILTSLMDILYHRISYGLLYDKGISLGFLASPFALGSPVQYLASWEFWAAIIYPASNKSFNRTTGLLICLIGLLGIGASPFSATVMIPRQGWWELGSSYANHMRNLTGEYYIFGNPYPLTADYSYTSPPLWCEAGAADCVALDIGAKASNLLNIVEDPPRLPYLQNISYDNYGTSNNRLISLSTAKNMSLSFSTSPMSFIAEAFARQYQSAKEPRLSKLLVKSQKQNGSDISNWKQPLMSVHCASHVSQGENPTFSFDGGFYQQYNVTVKLEDHMGVLKSFTRYNNVNELPGPLDPLIFNLQDQVSIPMSTALMFGGAVKRRQAGMTLEAGLQETPKMKFDLCLVHARWVEADVWQNYQSSNTLESDLGFGSEDILDYLRASSAPDNIINITTEYLGGIGSAASFNPGKFRNPVYRGLEKFCLGIENKTHQDWDTLTTDCLTINLALYLTNALAQSMTLALPGVADDAIFLRNTYHEYVYGYDFQGSISLRLAFATLLLHVCIALIHIGVVTLSEKSWYGLSWRSFGQMIVLALRSRSAFGLENTGAGVASSQTWSKTVFVGDIKGENKLEMAIPRRGGSFGGERGEEGAHRELLLRAKAGLKYS